MTAARRIVEAGLAHVAVLAELHRRCFEDAWSETAIGETLQAPGGFAYLALGPAADATGLPIGFALARRTGDDAELLTLCVLPALRRAGSGAALLDAVIDRVRRNGGAFLFLEVAETNDAARALYATRGFIAGRRRPDYYRAPNRAPIAALELRCDVRRRPPGEPQ
jgi:ribosomal protein S18 acetylase RimI-like enzyme